MRLPPHLTWRPAYTPQHGEEADPPVIGRSKEEAGAPGTASTGPPDQGAPGQKPGPQSCFSPDMLMMGGGMVLIFYFLLIRPQKKQEKAQKQMLSALKKGDRVVTNSGMHGIVSQLSDETVTLKVDKEGRFKLTFDRSAIARVGGGNAEAK